MKRSVLSAALLVGIAISASLVGTLARAADPATAAPILAASDSAFLREARSDNTTQIALGRIALKRSANPAVQKLAQALIDDLSIDNARLTKLARAKQVKLPAAEASSDEQQNGKLEQLKGAAFDKAWTKNVIAEQRHAVHAFSKASRKSDDAGVKAYATSALPLRKHQLEMAQKLKLPDARDKAMDSAMNSMKSGGFHDKPAGPSSAAAVPAAASIGAAPADKMPAASASTH